MTRIPARGRRMRVLFTAGDAVSHLYAMVPLAWALRAAGHEVRVATAPSFARGVTSTGLCAVAVGRDVDPGEAWIGFDLAAERAGGGSRPERTRRTMAMFRSAAEAIVDDVIGVAARWPADLIIFEPREYAGAVAAQVLGIPSARMLYGVDHTYALRKAEWPFLEPLWDRFGLPSVAAEGTVTIDPCPAALQVAACPARIGIRYIPYNGTAVVPRWLRCPAERPRVCATLGVSFGAVSGNLDPLRAWLTEIAELGVEVVAAVASQQRHLLGRLPDPVRVVSSLALHLLLPSCVLAVHHGGAGTTLTAAACGVPQLVVPVKGDQVLHADRVVAAGSGRAVPFSELRAGRIQQAAADVLGDPGQAAAAVRLRQQIAGHSPVSDVADALAQLVGESACESA